MVFEADIGGRGDGLGEIKEVLEEGGRWCLGGGLLANPFVLNSSTYRRNSLL